MNCNTKYAESLQYLFCCLDWLEKKIFNSTEEFIICKCFQSHISVGQLANTYNVRNIPIAHLSNIYNMMLDVLAGTQPIGQISNYDEQRDRAYILPNPCY